MAAKNARKPSGKKTQPSKPESGASAKSIALGTLSVGAIIGALAAALLGARKLGRVKPGDIGDGEHVPVDLMGDTHPGPNDRAVDAFRPDPTAPIPEGERDAFRPALAGAAAPTLVRGEARDNVRLDAAPS